MDSDRNGSKIDTNANRPVNSRLHSRVYMLVIGLTLWLVLSVWSFAGSGVTDYLLAVSVDSFSSSSRFSSSYRALGAATLQRTGRRHITIGPKRTSTPGKAGCAALKPQCKSCCRLRLSHSA